jgi:hypothetical protein
MKCVKNSKNKFLISSTADIRKEINNASEGGGTDIKYMQAKHGKTA